MADDEARGSGGEELRTIGRLAAEVHALPLGPLPALAPRWTGFLQGCCAIAQHCACTIGVA